MKVKEVIDLLSTFDPEADVEYSYMCLSEYGELIEDNGALVSDNVRNYDNKVEIAIR